MRELEEFAEAVALREQERVKMARDALNRHAVLDAAGVLATFAVVTRIVDFTGHYSKLTEPLSWMTPLLSKARGLRECIFPWYNRS